jgi:hypothetical protein
MYEKKIQRAEPGLIVMVLDDSGSMSDNLPTTTDPKYMWVERYTGQILQELLARSTEMRDDSAVVKPRYYLHLIVYGTHQKIWPDRATRESAGLADPDIHSELDIEQVIRFYATGDQSRKNTLGLSGMMSGTDTRTAFEKAYEVLSIAVTKDRFKKSFPPMLFHLTDGESQTDAEPIAEKIKQLATEDGNVLIINAFIGTSTSLRYSGPEDFPGYQTDTEAGPNRDSMRLFRMSSEAPETIRVNLIDDGIFPKIRQGSRLYFDVRTKEMLKHVIQAVGSQGSRYNR